MKKLILTLFVICVSAGTSVHADPIPGLFATGVDGLGSPLPDWSVDPHWVLTPPLGSGYSSIAFANNPRPPFWVPNTLSSRWIAPEQGDEPVLPGSTWFYTTSFDLTGFDPSSVVIEGQWAADDMSSILVNGSSTGISHAGGVASYSFFDNFLLDSSNASFTTGINTLTFRVDNIDGPTGLHVGPFRAEGNKAVPEPVGAALGVAILGASLLVRRRQKAVSRPVHRD